MYKIAKEFKFEAAHRLHRLDKCHPCHALHGHSYKVVVEIEADSLNSNTGFVIDFGELRWIKEWLDKNWDHAVIVASEDPAADIMEEKRIANKIFKLPYTASSAELMCKYLHNMISEKLNQNNETNRCFKITVKIWETANNMASYSE